LGDQVHFEKYIIMSQMIRYRNRDKGVTIKLGHPMAESHGLDIDKKSHPRLLMLTEWLGTHRRVVFYLHAAPRDQE
jgi:hypothetical protein